MDKDDLKKDPFEQFQFWYEEALNSTELQPEAMTLATANKEGKPSARQVLYKGIDRGGFLIFTNYESRKAKELNENPQGALVFHWPSVKRQIRVEGRVEKISFSESNRYFQTRERESRLGAWASSQSQILSSREEMDDKYQELEKKFNGKEIPCPPFWGGYRLIPDSFEFWSENQFRLHDRILYRRKENNWLIFRLAP